MLSVPHLVSKQAKDVLSPGAQRYSRHTCGDADSVNCSESSEGTLNGGGTHR
jgi:hypothetical protein